MSNNTVIQLIEEHQALIRKVCFMYAKNESEADDMFQEICIQVWSSFHRFKKDSQFSTWLYRIAINTAISWIRKENKHSSVNIDEPVNFNSIYDDNLFYEKEEKKEQLKNLHIAIKKLSEIDRTLIMLYLDEVAYSDISDITGLSVANIKVKMNRIKKRLKQLMDN